MSIFLLAAIVAVVTVLMMLVGLFAYQKHVIDIVTTSLSLITTILFVVVTFDHHPIVGIFYAIVWSGITTLHYACTFGIRIGRGKCRENAQGVR